MQRESGVVVGGVGGVGGVDRLVESHGTHRELVRQPCASTVLEEDGVQAHHR